MVAACVVVGLCSKKSLIIIIFYERNSTNSLTFVVSSKHVSIARVLLRDVTGWQVLAEVYF